MPEIRQIREGVQRQGVDEKIAWIVDVSGWTASPTSPSTIAKDSGGASISGVLSGTPTASGSTITLPTLQNLTSGCRYRIEFKFLDPGSNTLEGYMLVDGET